MVVSASLSLSQGGLGTCHSGEVSSRRVELCQYLGGGLHMQGCDEGKALGTSMQLGEPKVTGREES